MLTKIIQQNSINRMILEAFDGQPPIYGWDACGGCEGRFNSDCQTVIDQLCGPCCEQVGGYRLLTKVFNKQYVHDQDHPFERKDLGFCRGARKYPCPDREIALYPVRFCLACTVNLLKQ